MEKCSPVPSSARSHQIRRFTVIQNARLCEAADSIREELTSHRAAASTCSQRLERAKGMGELPHYDCTIALCHHGAPGLGVQATGSDSQAVANRGGNGDEHGPRNAPHRFNTPSSRALRRNLAADLPPPASAAGSTRQTDHPSSRLVIRWLSILSKACRCGWNSDRGFVFRALPAPGSRH